MDGGLLSRTAIGPQQFLPDELLLEILTRVPAKSLLRFRCVSRSWLSMISSREFIKTHLEKTLNDDGYTHHSIIAQYTVPHLHVKQFSVKSLMENPITPARIIDYPGEKPPGNTRVLGSCNGLICIVINYKDMYLWNPCTRRSKKLAGLVSESTSFRFTVHGFGYNVANDDYNVVLVSGVLGEEKVEEVAVYSLRTDSWRKIDDFPPRFPLTKSGVFVNGKLHWAGFGYMSSDVGVVYLDLARMEYGELRFPSCMGNVFGIMLGVLKKCLCVGFGYQKNMDLWVMKEYGVMESWIKIGSVPLYAEPLCMSDKGEVLLSAASDFRLYNLGDGSVTRRGIENMDRISPDQQITIESLGHMYLDEVTYVESLVSPFADDDAERLQGQQSQEWYE